jgi:hypothetical protein
MEEINRGVITWRTGYGTYRRLVAPSENSGFGSFKSCNNNKKWLFSEYESNNLDMIGTEQAEILEFEEAFSFCTMCGMSTCMGQNTNDAM